MRWTLYDKNIRSLALTAAQTLESLARRGVEPVDQVGPLSLDVPHRFEVAEECLRRPCLDETSRRCPHGRVGRDDTHALARAVLAREPLDQRVGVLRKTHVEGTARLVLPHSVEDEHAACSLRRDPARERVAQLARIREAAGVQQVVPVEEIESRVGHRHIEAFTLNVVSSVLDAIGNTPLVRLRRVTPESGAELWVKLEYLNPTGSMKDRMALAMIEGAERDGLIEAGTTVVEYTGGSTGPALALVCQAKGYRARIVISDCFSDERLQLMKALGADLEVIPAVEEKGRVTAEDIHRMVARAGEIASEPHHYATDQFNNPYVIPGHRGMLGREIWEQTDGRVAAFCHGIGTAGSLMGVSQALKEREENVRVVALEPGGSAAITGGAKGSFAIQGWTGVVPPHWDADWIDDVWTIEDGEATEMTKRLAREEGIFAGVSSGANVVGALRLAEQLGAGDVVVTLAVDSGFKYMTGAPYS